MASKIVLGALVLLSLLVLIAEVRAGTSRYCYRVASRRTYRNVYRYYRCGWGWWGWGWGWGWRRWCRRTICIYTTVTWRQRHCCTGYTGSRCDIPVCNPPCGEKGFCLSPNKCSCPSGLSGTRCEIKLCSYAKDCYPGTCSAGGGSPTCSCSSGYEGADCSMIRRAADFEKCGAVIKEDLSGQELSVKSGECTDPGDRVFDYWVNATSLSSVEMTWRTLYHEQEDLPHRPSYMSEFRLGIVKAYAVITQYNAVNGIERNETVNCISPVSSDNPHYSSQCDNVRHYFPGTLGIAHGHKLAIKMYADVGGFKKINNQGTGNIDTHYFSPLQKNSFQQVEFKIDDVPPYHCSKVAGMCNETAAFAVSVGGDITPNGTIYLDAFGWEDDDSGLVSYNFSIYKLLLDGEDLLAETEEPIGGVNVSGLYDGNSTSYQLPDGPWMYSVLLRVYDAANNFASARGLVFYKPDDSQIETTNVQLSISGAVSGGGYIWLHTLDQYFQVNWAGRYINRYLHDNGLLNRVKSRSEGLEVDDETGNRTVEEVPNSKGITNFEIGHDLHPRSASIPTNPRVWETLYRNESNVVNQNSIANDGRAVAVWVRATDFFNNTKVDSLLLGFDSSPPIISNNSDLEKNVKPIDATIPYVSRVAITTYDLHSGLSSVSFVLFIPDTGITVSSGTVTFSTVHNDRNRCNGIEKCTCSDVGGECFANEQYVYVNNCDLKNHRGSTLWLNSTVYNRAQLFSNRSAQVGMVEGLGGLEERPGPVNLRNSSGVGNNVTIEWDLAGCLVASRFIMTIEIDGKIKEFNHDAHAKRMLLTGLRRNTDYELKARIQYDDGALSEEQTLEFNSGDCPENDYKCRHESGSNIALIVGIVIAVLLLLIIIILVVFVIIRLRQKKSPVPRRVRNTMVAIQNRFSRGPPAYQADLPPGHRELGAEAGAFGLEAGGLADKDALMTFNVAYVAGAQMNYGFQGDDEDIYMYGNQEDLNLWTSSTDHIDLGETIKAGRFAVIRKATVLDYSGKRVVAAKLLRAGASEEDKLLMRAKMNFLATGIAPSEFIVNIVGAIREIPVLLLELCDRSLKEWLESISKKPMSDEIDDHMLNFTNHISKGMAHLHENGVVHRRLAARNVLLKNVSVGMVAKVTGFGPMKGEEEGSNEVNDAKEKIPIKWMAPESLTKPPGVKRTYNEKTDVWSYGVTIWEIFSKGDSPFRKHKASEVKKLLPAGTRLAKPVDCNNELYNDLLMPCWSLNPAERPNFADITRGLDRLFHGRGGNSEEYYYGGDTYDSSR